MKDIIFIWSVVSIRGGDKLIQILSPNSFYSYQNFHWFVLGMKSKFHADWFSNNCLLWHKVSKMIEGAENWLCMANYLHVITYRVYKNGTHKIKVKCFRNSLKWRGMNGLYSEIISHFFVLLIEHESKIRNLIHW